MPLIENAPTPAALRPSLMSLLPTFTTLGSGPTVLMLHDADSGHLSFAPQVETLASQGYRAVAWDMPGYGHSAPVEPYNFLGLVRRCQALIAALECEHLTLVGHGLGAMLALELALRAGDTRVGGLVLCAGGPPLDAQALAHWHKARKQALAAGHSMEQLAELLVPQQVGSGALPEGARLAQHAMSKVHRATYARALDVMGGFGRTASELARIHQPVLVIGGAQDRSLAPEALDALARLLPDAQRVSLPGIGHWPQLEAPDAFDAALLSFLAAPRVLH